jgi:periplasmic copper chaperone A
MRYLLGITFAAILVAATGPAFAQSSVQVEKPWARETPGGATTGAVYLTINNRSSAADRLTGGSSEVADKLQIHEMKVVNGVMQMREVSGGLRVPANGTVVLKPGSYQCHADWAEEAPQGRR